MGLALTTIRTNFVRPGPSTSLRFAQDDILGGERAAEHAAVAASVADRDGSASVAAGASPLS
jgi:hypothetical protein